MIVKCEGAFIGKSKFIAKNGVTYHSAKFVDKIGGEMEVSCKYEVDLKQFSFYIIEVDVVQGKYPRYNLVNVIEAK